MSQANAIVVAALIAIVGYLVNHGLGRWAERRRSEEQAVTDLATTAMAVQGIVRFGHAFADGPLWRQLFVDRRPAVPREAAIAIMERGLAKIDEVVRAHGELIQHARADLVDAAGDVLNASLAISAAWDGTKDVDVDAAEYRLGQTRLRLLRTSRGRRAWRWRLGTPSLFDNIDEDGVATS